MDPNTQPPMSSTPSYQAPGAPGYPPTGPAGEDPGKTLAIVGIILAFFFTLAGLIVSIVAKNKSTAAGFKNSLATVGIVLNAVFMVLGLLAAIFWFVVIASAVNSASSDMKKTAEQSQQQANAQKDFKKGEVGKFGDLEVSVNKVKRNYQPENKYLGPSKGKEYVIVNVTVKNTGDESKYVGPSTLQLNDNGVSTYSTYVSGLEELESGNLSPGASTTGNVAFEVKKGAKDLKLQYEESALVTTGSSTEFKKLTYTLEI